MTLAVQDTEIVPDDQTETIEFLSRPATYGLSQGAVERHETHGSIVFLAGKLAYKLKRSVKFPYMDYSTVALRHAMCERELEVNRRMAPELYVAVRPVLRDAGGGCRLGESDRDGTAVDWVVIMRRFAQEDLLEQMRQKAKLTPALMREVATRVARLHAEAPVRSDRGGAGGMRSVMEENLLILRSMAGRPFDARKIDRYETAIRGCFDAASASLEERRLSGHVRRVHGDLHLNNICMVDGRPMPFDAIEFSDDFSCIDTLYDLAFLLMDLDRHGLCICANALLNRYLEDSQDYDGLRLMPLFLSCRAAIRAHVAVSTADARPERKTSLHAEAMGFLDRAISYLEPAEPLLLAIGGVSGTGKSVLARQLAPLVGRVPGAVILRSDSIRKRLWGVEPETALPKAAYGEAFTNRVFTTMFERAAAILRSGSGVIADAVFRDPSQRNELARIAERAHASFCGLWLEAPRALLEERIKARHNDVSDATVEVLRKQLEAIVAPADWARIDVACTLDEAAAQAVRALNLAG